MYNYLVLQWASGIVRTTAYRDKWVREKSKYAELLHNEFFTNTMPRNEFELINKYFDCDLRFVNLH
jgi:hypothetical protein